MSTGGGLRVGVDSGGTFSDVAIFDPRDGSLTVWKGSSTPHDPSVGIVDATAQGLASRGVDGAAVGQLGHGTTVATNALIEGRFARTGMVTTRGFRDVVEIGRQLRPRLYDVQVERPAPIATRDLRFEIAGRVRFDATEEAPLDVAGLRESARRLKQEGVTAVAVCFLFSFLRPAHEEQAMAILAEELPEAFICASHVVAPEIREFERFSTTLVNAGLGPVIRAYLDRLTPALRGLGISVPPRITQSNGGVMSAANASRFPARVVLSGPAAGVTTAQELGRLAGVQDLITFDMGGTSTDVALIDRGVARIATDLAPHGRPLRTPMLDIHTVGAGGGSIAFIDAGGHLKVGPRSAAAVPGPVCYGLGATEPTVTDAHVVLGALSPTHLLGGRMPIDRDRAAASFEPLARQLGFDVIATAQGVVSVVIANMARAIRVVSVERGYDPRDYALMAFGGAGPLHAARLARELGMERVIVPRHPGVACAMGLLLSDPKTHFSAGRLMKFNDAAAGVVSEVFADLAIQAREWFEFEGVAKSDRRLALSLDMRYEGQGHELTVRVPGDVWDASAPESVRGEFESAHRQVYGFISPDEALEIVAVRLEAAGAGPKATIGRCAQATTPVAAARIGSREMWLPEAGGAASCALYAREALGPGHVVEGPAIIEQMDSTTLILPGQVGRVDPWLNLVMEERR